MAFLVIGILSVVAFAPYTFYSVRRSMRRQQKAETPAIYLFPIIQVSTGGVLIGLGIYMISK